MDFVLRHAPLKVPSVTFEPAQLETDLALAILLHCMSRHGMDTRRGVLAIPQVVMYGCQGTSAYQEHRIIVGHYASWQRAMVQLYSGWWSHNKSGISKQRLKQMLDPYVFQFHEEDLNRMIDITKTFPMPAGRRTRTEGIFALSLTWFANVCRFLYDDDTVAQLFHDTRHRKKCVCTEFKTMDDLKQSSGISTWLLSHMDHSKLYPGMKALPKPTCFTDRTPLFGVAWNKRQVASLDRFKNELLCGMEYKDRLADRHWANFYELTQDTPDDVANPEPIHDEHMKIPTDSNYSRKNVTRRAIEWADKWGISHNDPLVQRKKKIISGKLPEDPTLDQSALCYVLNSADRDILYSEADGDYVKQLQSVIDKMHPSDRPTG